MENFIAEVGCMKRKLEAEGPPRPPVVEHEPHDAYAYATPYFVKDVWDILESFADAAADAGDWDLEKLHNGNGLRLRFNKLPTELSVIVGIFSLFDGLSITVNMHQRLRYGKYVTHAAAFYDASARPDMEYVGPWIQQQLYELWCEYVDGIVEEEATFRARSEFGL